MYIAKLDSIQSHELSAFGIESHMDKQNHKTLISRLHTGIYQSEQIYPCFSWVGLYLEFNLVSRCSRACTTLASLHEMSKKRTFQHIFMCTIRFWSIGVGSHLVIDKNVAATSSIVWLNKSVYSIFSLSICMVVHPVQGWKGNLWSQKLLDAFGIALPAYNGVGTKLDRVRTAQYNLDPKGGILFERTLQSCSNLQAMLLCLSDGCKGTTH